MDCDRIRELILTDYSDGQIDQALRQSVDAHLAACLGCRQFKELAQRSAIAPLSGMKETLPDERVWMNIKDEITRERRPVFAGAFDRPRTVLADIFYTRRPVFTVASAAALVFLAFFIIKGPVSSRRAAGDQMAGQINVYSSLDTAETDGSLGTSIEQFLF